MNKMNELVKLLNRANDSYYNSGTPIMTDKEYDDLYDLLIKMENESGITLANSPTRCVGFPIVDSLDIVKHNIPLRSLKKVKGEIKNVVKWIGTDEYCAMLKLDGCTMKVEYINGKLHRASTRGNGYEGKDITEHAKAMINLPHSLNKEIDLTVIGEVIIKNGDFAHYNAVQSEENKLKNNRNAVAGTLAALDTSKVRERSLRFYAFDCIEDLGVETHTDKLRELGKLGLHIVIAQNDKDGANIGSSISFLSSVAEMKGFPIDGIVVTYDKLDKRDSLGTSEKHPHHSIAYKFEDDYELTTFKGIEWSMSRAGILTPVALFDTVELDGSNVSKASLHNVSILKSFELGMGDTIKVEKSNMIIPQVVSNLTKSNTLEVPTHCPYCGEELTVKKDKDTEVLVCNASVLRCKEKNVKLLANACGKNGLNIKGLSEETIRVLINNEIIFFFEDILDLAYYKDEILKLEGFKAKKLDNILNAIEEAKNTTLERYLYALDIQGVGVKTAKDIAYKFKSIEKIAYALKEEFLKIDSVNEKTAQNLVDYFTTNRDDVVGLAKDYLTFEEIVEVKGSGALDNLVFAITGSLEKFTNRNDLVAYIEANGGKYSKTVTNKVDYLISNDISPDNKKVIQATQKGAVIIQETDLIGLVTRFEQSK